MTAAYLEVLMVHGGLGVISQRIFNGTENMWKKIDQKVAVKNTTTTWTLPSFKGRGAILILSRTKPNGDGSVSAKINNQDANNIALNIKPCLLLSQNPTTLYLINASTTTDEDIELYAITKSDLT